MVTGAVTVSAVIGMLSLLAGVGLGWWLRRTSNWCTSCGEHLRCAACQPIGDQVRVDSAA